MRTVADTIRDLGGDETVAGICGVSVGAVRNWRSYDRFPGYSWLALAPAAAARGVRLSKSQFHMDRKPGAGRPRKERDDGKGTQAEADQR